MSSGLIALLDDITALAKVAATSLDDAGAMAAKAGGKAAGIVTLSLIHSCRCRRIERCSSRWWPYHSTKNCRHMIGGIDVPRRSYNI